MTTKGRLRDGFDEVQFEAGGQVLAVGLRQHRSNLSTVEWRCAPAEKAAWLAAWRAGKVHGASTDGYRTEPWNDGVYGELAKGNRAAKAESMEAKRREDDSRAAKAARRRKMVRELW